jgi:hypothetical protein
MGTAMLQRLDQSDAARRAAAAERRREQQRRHRQRLAANRRCYLVELDGQVLDCLVKTHWLAADATGNDEAVARAVTALLLDTAEKT